MGSVNGAEREGGGRPAAGGSPWVLRIGRAGSPLAVELGWRLLLLLATLAAFGFLLLGVAAGRLWEGALAERAGVRLEERLAGLEGERRRLESLAARLEAMEEDYRRIRRIMGGEVVASSGDVALPPLPAAPGDRRGGGDESVDAAGWAWPLTQPGFVTRSFGSPLDAAPGGHPGLDIAVPLGSYVRASAPGVVVEAEADEVYGYYVRIAHRDGLSSLYAHNSWIFVAPGDTVDRLEVIAVSGNTGRSTAPHLHFEVERNGERLDPLRYVALGR